MVFVDYLTKGLEVLATGDQAALTIAKLLVEHVISHHGIPVQILSDSGASFLSQPVKEVCKFLGVERVNTTAHNPQTNGLVERFNWILTSMAKQVECSGRYWATQLLNVLFAYSASLQGSTRESSPDCQQHCEGIMKNHTRK